MFTKSKIMLFSSIGFLFIIGIIVVTIGGSIYWILNKKEMSFNISAGVGAFAALLAGITIFTYRTVVIVIEDDNSKQYSMLGSADYEFRDGTTESIPKLDFGDIVINDSKDTCVIIRADYTEGKSGENQELIDIVFMVKPNAIFVLDGKDIDYFFNPAPDYLEVDENAAMHTLVKYELQYLLPEHWETYYVYDGPVIAGVPNGTGKFYFSQTNYYEGELEDAKFQGEGKMIYSDSEWYEGGYVNDQRSGHGFYQYDDLTTYEGEWLEDEKSGTGIQVYYNGDIYEGEFKNSQLHGEGKYTFESGDYYEGEFFDGYFQGKGKWYYASTDTFKEGTWYEDEYVEE